MYGTVKQFLKTLGPMTEKIALIPLISAIADRLSSQATSTAGLVISAAASALAKTGAAFAGVANGVAVAIASGTNMPALTGINTSAAGQYVIAAFFIDSGSNVTVLGGNAGATLALATFPQTPVGKALVGYLVITNGGGAFVGGTTALDTATTVYVSPVGAFDPTILLG